jgi:hypothetical protein
VQTHHIFIDKTQIFASFVTLCVLSVLARPDSNADRVSTVQL